MVKKFAGLDALVEAAFESREAERLVERGQNLQENGKWFAQRALGGLMVRVGRRRFAAAEVAFEISDEHIGLPAQVRQLKAEAAGEGADV